MAGVILITWIEMVREKKEENKVRTTIDISREAWSFVKCDSTLKGKKTSEIIEDLIRQVYDKKSEK
jgi:hypothetical protein